MSRTLNDLTGQRFGMLTVIERAPRRGKAGNARWFCRCDCGNLADHRGQHLTSGKVTACGCQMAGGKTRVAHL